MKCRNLLITIDKGSIIKTIKLGGFTMKKKLVTMALAGALTVGSAFTALAGWEQTGTTWKYQTNGTYYNDGWHWIDGNGDNVAECYYFNIDSTMLSNATTPDNFTVNADGAWTVNGIVQTKVLNGSTSSTGQSNNNTPNQQSQANNDGYYNDNGAPDIGSIADGILAGDPAAHDAAQDADTGGNAIGNFDWN